MLVDYVNEGINEGATMLLNYIKNNPGQRVSQISEQVQTPVKTLERWIKELKVKDKIEFRGAKKTGGYYIKGIYG